MPPHGFEVDPEATRLFNEKATFVLTDHTLSLLATKEGDMFLYADPEGNLRGGELGMGFYYRDTEPYGQSLSLPDFYQNTFHAHHYIQKEWSRYFEVVDIQPDSM